MTDYTVFLKTLSDVHFITPTWGVFVALGLTLALLFLSGFASGSEISFFSLSPTDLSILEEGKTNADKKILSLREDSERTLATILITNNFVNVTIIMLCNYIFVHTIDFGDAKWLEFICITVLLTFLLLLFGEIMPKVYGRQKLTAVLQTDGQRHYYHAQAVLAFGKHTATKRYTGRKSIAARIARA